LSLSAFVEFTRAAGMAVLATASPAGKPEAALLGVAVTESGELVVDILGTAAVTSRSTSTSSRTRESPIPRSRSP
jgi:predicted small integral membrane protein